MTMSPKNNENDCAGAAADRNQPSSRRAAKKEKRKRQKAEKKHQVLAAYLLSDGSDKKPAGQHAVLNASVGGKAARARLARRCDDDAIAGLEDGADAAPSRRQGWQQHRPQGGAPILSQVLPQWREIVEFLEQKEREMRIRGRGESMRERTIVEVDCHGSMDAVRRDADAACETETCDVSRMGLRGNFALASLSSLMAPPGACIFSSLKCLDLSRNELWSLSADAIEPLGATLEVLDISRNWFESLPESMGGLFALKELRASHNLLKPNALNLAALSRNMKQLAVIDLRFNQKCGKQSLLEALQSSIGDTRIELKMTVTYPPPSGDSTTTQLDRVGASPAVRDPTLLRSQLEPWSSMTLRRRLVADFGLKLTEDGRSWADEEVSRGRVMDELLKMYEEEAAKGGGSARTDENGRAVVNVSGTLVEASIRDRVLNALKAFWSETSPTGNRERPSIRAENYMILCSPSMFDPTSQKATKAACKLKRHEALWNLAFEAIHSVDPAFAAQYTAVAVTRNFAGSPHIDKQNCGPFYGFSVGNFDDGTGSIMVECSARVVAAVDSKNRMAKVDGRFPHWVGPYDEKKDRYSLVYYRTGGENDPVGPAVFALPK